MQEIFETSDVEDVIGISRTLLNKFVERSLYGIVPSERMDVGRGRRRWFNQNDVFGIALVWWLFEAGLRSDVISRVLRELSGNKEANAKKAALVLLEDHVDFLAIQRAPRSASRKSTKQPQQSVRTVDKDEVVDLVRETDKAVTIIFPVGEMLWKLGELMADSDEELK